MVDVANGTATFKYEAAIDSSDGVSGFSNVGAFTNAAITDAEAKQSLIRGAIELCKRSDAADATSGRIVDNVPLELDNPFNANANTDTRDFYIGYLGGNLTDTNQTTEICDLPASDSLPVVDAISPVSSNSSNSSGSSKLQGALAIQFGYNFEKYRVSLTSFSNKGGANRLTNNLVVADWFLAQGFYAGLGITGAKLETPSLNSIRDKGVAPHQAELLSKQPRSNAPKSSTAPLLYFAKIKFDKLLAYAYRL